MKRSYINNLRLKLQFSFDWIKSWIKFSTDFKIFKNSIGEIISYVQVFNKDLLTIFKQRINQDVRNFEAYSDSIDTKEFINNIDDKDFIAFRGSYCK